MVVLASSGFGTILIGIIMVMVVADSGSWTGTTGRIVIGSGVVILVTALVVTRRLRKKIQRNLKRK